MATQPAQGGSVPSWHRVPDIQLYVAVMRVQRRRSACCAVGQWEIELTKKAPKLQRIEARSTGLSAEGLASLAQQLQSLASQYMATVMRGYRHDPIAHNGACAHTTKLQNQ